MTAVSKKRWILSLILGGILLILAFIGGSWKISYAAEGGITANPVINFIVPSSAPVGSPDVMMIIFGANFGEVENFVRIWIKDGSHDYKAAPVEVTHNGISVVITDTLMVSPNLYTVRVVKSNGQSVPTVPPDPSYDTVSNQVAFAVYQPLYIYMPIITKTH